MFRLPCSSSNVSLDSSRNVHEVDLSGNEAVYECTTGLDEDVIGPEGMEKFCEDIGVEPENVSFPKWL